MRRRSSSHIIVFVVFCAITSLGTETIIGVQFIRHSHGYDQTFGGGWEEERMVVVKFVSALVAFDRACRYYGTTELIFTQS